MTVRYDLAIAGGGPAGLALGILAARRGFSTVLLEKRTLPCDKPCGEGLMPRGVAQLKALGVLDRLGPADAHPFVGIRYVQEDGTAAEARFPDGRPGLGIRRVALVEALAAAARAAGVEVRERCPVLGHRRRDAEVLLASGSGELSARLLVAADGLASPLRRAEGLDRPAGGPRRFGLRQHFAVEPWSPFVEIHFADHLEAYVTPAGARRVGIAFLWEDGRISGRIDVPALLHRFPALKARVAGAAADSTPWGAGPLERVAIARTADRLALLGDAAGYADALTGEGLSLAFTCAAALADLLPAALAAGATAESLRPYEAAAARAYRPYLLLTRFMLEVARRPFLRRRLVATLRRAPWLFQRALAALMA